MIAALAAAQLTAAGPALAAEPPRDDVSTAQPVGDGVEPGLAEGPAPAAENAPQSAPTLAAREDEPKKRKSTGDKVLTGAAVVLGIGALAVGGLLVALFVG